MESALRLLIHTIKTYQYKVPSYNRSYFEKQCSFDDLIPKLNPESNKFLPKFLKCDPHDAIISANYSTDYGQKMNVSHNGFHTKLSLSRDLTPIGFCVSVFYQSPDFFLDVSNAETREFMSPQQPVLYFIDPNTPELKIQHRYREKDAPINGTIYPPLLFCRDETNNFKLIETKLPPAFHYTIPIPNPQYSSIISIITSFLPIVLTIIILLKLFVFNKQENKSNEVEAKIENTNNKKGNKKKLD